MDGSEDTEPPEDGEMADDGEPIETDDSEDEWEFWETQEEIVDALYDHGAYGHSDEIARIWGIYYCEKNYSNCYDRHRWQEDML